MEPVKTIGIVAMLLITACGAIRAAAATPEACLQQERELKTRESDNCSGLNYLFNPSPCYAAQRALKEFRSGECRGFLATSRGNTASRPAAQGAPAPAPPKVAETAKPAKPESPVLATRQEAQSSPAKPAGAVEKLLAENSRLRAENARLNDELERLKSLPCNERGGTH